MFKINYDDVSYEVLLEDDIQSCSNMMMDEAVFVFTEDDFQIWALSEEAIKIRRDYGFNDGTLELVQFVAKLNQEIIGVLEIENYVNIQNFFVRYGYQNMGIEKGLLHYAIQFFYQHGITLNELKILTTKSSAENFKNLGFKETGKKLWLTLDLNSKVKS